jgi:hypothetical protein
MRASDETAETATASRISRRNALKAGVAAGVGAAVWGGPQIGRIGSTPAYAAHCTPGEFETATTNKTNTSWANGCGPSTDAHMSYKKTEQEFPSLPGQPTFKTYNDAGDNFLCSAEDAKFTIEYGDPSANVKCQALVKVYNESDEAQFFEISGNLEAGSLAALAESHFTTAGWSTNGSWFYKAELTCGPATCFHP